MDLTINGLKKSRVTITNELQQYQLGKGSNNKKYKVILLIVCYYN